MNKNWILFQLIWVIFTPSTAIGTLVPSRFILKKWTESLSTLPSFKAKTHLFFVSPTEDTPLFEETLYFHSDSKTFSSILTPMGNKHPLPCIQRTLSNASVWMQLCFESDLPSLLETLKHIHLWVPSELESPQDAASGSAREFLARWQKITAFSWSLSWVISNNAFPTPQTQVPQTQIWFKKDEFLLQQLVFLDNQNLLNEIQVQAYHPFHGASIPSEILLSQNHVPTLRIRMLEIKPHMHPEEAPSCQPQKSPTISDKKERSNPPLTQSLSPSMENLFYGVFR